MRLDKQNLFTYLIGRSWLDTEALISGDAVVIERRLRHTSFVVEQQGGGGLFVKQLHDPHPEAAASLRREAGLYTSISEGRLPELGPLVPAFVGYDEHERVLALARFEGRSAQDRAVAGRPPTAVEASALGTALAALHRVSAEAARAATPGALGEDLPWAFHLDHAIAYSPSAVPGAGPAMLGVLRS
ncbi:MAG: hypothetical protein MI919_35505, partial [Holophagales bacterium]|nr:hypothetical protein [Holophagales bacterium]